MVSPDNLIPPDSELAHMLGQWSEDTDSRTWRIANVTNELIEEVGMTISRADIYRAVAVRCKGNKVNTIRRWAECAADYSQEMQEKYAELLSFNHFKTARRLLADKYIPSLEYALEWCVTGNDDKLTAGKFHTVNEMIFHFVPQEEVSYTVQAWRKSKERLYDAFVIVDNDTDRQELLAAWHIIDSIINKSEDTNE